MLARLEVLDAWFACAWLGASLVPVNTATRGPRAEFPALALIVGLRTLLDVPGLGERAAVERALKNRPAPGMP